MRHLNYGHLLYFWTVAREGSITKASDVLNVTPQTISGQLKQLDASIGQPLFSKQGRRLVLSEMGRIVYEYAEDIFTIGTELATVVRGRPARGPALVNIGVVMSMPKLVAERIVAPVLTGADPVRVACRAGSLEQMLADLAVHRLDLVLSDQPVPPGLNLRAWNHRLGSSGMSFFATRGRAAGLRRKFPLSLQGEPMLMPSRESALRRNIDTWLESNDLQPAVVAEFDDSALLKAFGETGAGTFAAPTVIEREICRMYRTSVVGRAPDVREDFYAISPERRLRQDAVVAICDTARRDLFSDRETAKS